MAKPPVRIRVVITDDKPTLVSSDFVPTTGSVGAAATAVAADTAVTSSFAITASFAQNVNEATGTFSGSFTGSLLGTGSWAENVITASFAQNAATASLAVTASSTENAATASLAVTASSVVNAATASFLLGSIESASVASTASYVRGIDVDGAVALADSASDVAYDDVRNKPDGLISSSAQITGQLDVEGVTGSFTGSFIGDGSGITGTPSATFTETASAGSTPFLVDVAEIRTLGSAAIFAHRDNATATSFALGQEPGGHVHLNAPTGEHVEVHFNGVDPGPFRFHEDRFESEQNIIVTGSVSASDGFTGSFIGNLEGTADTGSYVAGGNVDGAVAALDGEATGTFTGSFIGDGSNLNGVIADSAASASDVAYDDVRDKPPLISSSAQITGQLDVTGVTGSYTGTFIGDGSGLSGVIADSAQTASYVAGGNVDGQVASASHAEDAEFADTAGTATSSLSAITASDVAYDDVRDKPALISSSAQFDAGDDFTVGQVDAVGATGSFTGSLIGGINLTDPSDMTGSTFVHQMPAISGKSADFTISLDDNQNQQFAISASLEFLVEGGSVGGFYSIHFINSGAFGVTWPSDMKYHAGTAITTSLVSGALDIYTMTRLPDGTYASSIFGQEIS